MSTATILNKVPEASGGFKSYELSPAATAVGALVLVAVALIAWRVARRQRDRTQKRQK